MRLKIGIYHALEGMDRREDFGVKVLASKLYDNLLSGISCLRWKVKIIVHLRWLGIIIITVIIIAKIL